MLTKEQKENWIKALRSGEYQQGRNRLCTTLNGKSSYCCLGVLAETLNIPYEDVAPWKLYGSASYIRSTTVLSLGQR